ncbi:TIGR03943 family putative permease subunit [Microbacterium sp. Marseille-Q6965]|uniref:TIGR03943 family putative permease subunit n=1 Tax=Microbacterium sp. Marseille-Q6965 TaxID=2965072 RepID=UPI0021B83746|nr:TIGR03943 family protein [Microbacterium sp. Marseille-Q6965]
MSERLGSLGTRWLGLGLASVLAVVTIGLATTGRLALYINPAQNWFAVGMAVIVLIGAVASFALPLGAEADHGHDHGGPARDPDSSAHDHGEHRAASRGPRAALVVGAVGGALATGVTAGAILLPPASLSVELAMERDTGTAPLFAGADDVVLAAGSDTSDYGVGDWAAVFARATNPDAFDGAEVALTGFVTPAGEGEDGIRLGRLVITHCVIDAQPASLPVAPIEADVPVGAWIRVEGVVTATSQGELVVEPTSVAEVSEPEDPYEY